MVTLSREQVFQLAGMLEFPALDALYMTAHHEGDRNISEAEIREALVKTFRDFCQVIGAPPELTAELTEAHIVSFQ